MDKGRLEFAKRKDSSQCKNKVIFCGQCSYFIQYIINNTDKVKKSLCSYI